MSAFSYSALDTSGKKCRGTLESDSERQVRQQLRDQGLIPLTIVPLREKSQRHEWRYKLKLSELALISRHLAALVATGVAIGDALQTVAQQSTTAHVKTILTLVLSEVMAGQSLANSLARMPRAFPQIYTATVAAGEASGQLDTILLSLADYFERQNAIRRKVLQALLYPTVMLLVAFSVVGFLLTYVVPKMVAVFTDSHQALPTLTKILISLSAGLQHQGIIILILLFAVIVGYRWLQRNPMWRKRCQQFYLRLPIIRGLLIQSDNVRFCYTLAVLLRAGVDILQALQSATDVVYLLPLREKLMHVFQRVREGETLARALRATQDFSPMTLHFIANGEATSQLAAMLQHAAQQQDAELHQTIDTGLTLFEPFLILFMGGMVLFIVLAILLPIFSMDQLTRLS